MPGFWRRSPPQASRVSRYRRHRRSPRRPPRRRRRRARRPRAPLFATTKVEGTDNVYIFRYQNHQSMFVVTPAGVIATDPISYGRPQAATTYRRRDQEGHQGADQVPGLQPPPLRSHRRRQAVQGRGRDDRRAQARQGAAGGAEGARRRHARRDRRRQAHDQARRHDARAASTPGATTPTRRW